MSHITARGAYKNLEERLNKFPQEVRPSKALYDILSILFTEKEADLVAQLTIKAFRVKTAAKIWSVKESWSTIRIFLMILRAFRISGSYGDRLSE